MLTHLSTDTGSPHGALPNHMEKSVRRTAEVLTQIWGGVDGLGAQFQARGLGHLVKAWRSGDRLAVTPQELYSVIGHDTLVHLADFVDLSRAQTLAGLSGYLPAYINEISHR